jgi:CrcB protein
MLTRFLLVCLAGAFGTGTRYLVGIGAAKAFGTTFPWGTLIVNVLGCFLIAAIVHVSLVTTHFSEGTRIVLTTGFMGGLTTYSSFNQETTLFVRQGAYRIALANASITLVLCFVAGLAGFAAARAMFES